MVPLSSRLHIMRLLLTQNEARVMIQEQDDEWPGPEPEELISFKPWFVWVFLACAIVLNCVPRCIIRWRNRVNASRASDSLSIVPYR